jgi:hypothetical protein
MTASAPFSPVDLFSAWPDSSKRLWYNTFLQKGLTLPWLYALDLLRWNR